MNCTTLGEANNTFEFFTLEAGVMKDRPPDGIKAFAILDNTAATTISRITDNFDILV